MSWLDDEAPDTVRDKRQWAHQLVPEALTSTFGPEGGRMDHRKPTNVKRPIPENHLGPCTSGATRPTRTGCAHALQRGPWCQPARSGCSCRGQRSKGWGNVRPRRQEEGLQLNAQGAACS